MKVSLAAFILVIAISSFSCSKENTPTSPITPVLIQAEAEKTLWEQEWNATLIAAKKEGRVVVYSSMGSEVRTNLIKAFKERMGLSLEIVTGRGGEMSQKLLAERRAGLYMVDVYTGGSTTIFNDFMPSKALDPLEPALILPQVTEPRVWFEKRLPFVDRERKYVLGFTAFPFDRSVTINSDYIRKEEITSYYDLLSPKYKGGKIGLNDPMVAGRGLSWFGLALSVPFLDEGYMTSLARQEPIISRNERLLVEWLARGKILALIGMNSESILEIIRSGVPLEELKMKEDKPGFAVGTGHLVLINKAPHPDAAKVFINWLLSQEAQTINSIGENRQSSRIDVTTEHLKPHQILDTKSNYFNTANEEYRLKQTEQIELARKIFGHLIQ